MIVTAYKPKPRKGQGSAKVPPIAAIVEAKAPKDIDRERSRAPVATTPEWNSRTQQGKRPTGAK